MGKRIRDYVKYTLSELEDYVRSPQSCVNKVNTTIHLNIPPYALDNFRETLREIIAQKKIGCYDSELKGIILDIRNIKVISDVATLRFDDPAMHCNIQADCYVFKPEIGSIVCGQVMHLSARQISVIIYRVFSVSIRLVGRVPPDIHLNSEIDFRIKQFDLENDMPFIEGELVGEVADESCNEPVQHHKARKSISFETKENRSSGYESDGSHSRQVKLEMQASSSYKTGTPVVNTSNRPSRRSTQSPDLFGDSSDSDIPLGQEIKQEKPSQTPKKKAKIDSSIKQEKLSQSSTTRVTRSQSNSSDTSASGSERGSPLIKQEKLSQINSKSANTNNSSDDSDMEPIPRVKHEKSPVKTTQLFIEPEPLSQSAKVRIKAERASQSPRKSRISESDDSLTPRRSAKHSNVPPPEADLIQSSSKKRKHTESASEPQSPSVVESKRKRKKSSIAAEVVIDTDFEMTTTFDDLPKKKKKKKKSKDSESEPIAEPSEETDFSLPAVAAKKKKVKKEKL